MLAFFFTCDRRQRESFLYLTNKKEREDGTDSVTPLWNYFSLGFRLSPLVTAAAAETVGCGVPLAVELRDSFSPKERERERERMTAKEKEGFPLMDAMLPYAVRRSSLQSHRWPNMVNCCCFRFEIKESWETLTTNYEYGIAKKRGRLKLSDTSQRTTHHTHL